MSVWQNVILRALLKVIKFYAVLCCIYIIAISQNYPLAIICITLPDVKQYSKLIKILVASASLFMRPYLTVEQLATLFMHRIDYFLCDVAPNEFLGIPTDRECNGTFCVTVFFRRKIRKRPLWLGRCQLKKGYCSQAFRETCVLKCLLLNCDYISFKCLKMELHEYI